MRPARVQVSQQDLDEFLREKRPEGGTYNIWHHRYSGLERDFRKQSTRAKYKVNVARDSGETVGSRTRDAYFCIFFAKGMCTKGHRCSMWHRVPTDDDPQETTIDCFGRDKFTDFRQDMGGVGGFLRDNKTLYIGRISIKDSTKDAITRQFGQFGTLEKVRLLEGRGVAFVTYKTRSQAEFAREAMMNQSLEDNEILNVRWATSDPRFNQVEGYYSDSEEEEEVVPVQLQKKKVVEKVVVEEERQEYEADLPAEFTSMKREFDQDGLSELETSMKKQKQEEQVEAETYTQQDYENYYYYQQQQYYLQQQKEQEEQNKKVAGIIPQNVLSSLKSISKNATLTASTPVKKDTSAGLGILANYGSDSEDDE